MRAETFDQAVEAGYRSSYADMPRVISRCDFVQGVHAFLAALEKEAGLVRGILIRAVMGWVTDYLRRHHCS